MVFDALERQIVASWGGVRRSDHIFTLNWRNSGQLPQTLRRPGNLVPTPPPVPRPKRWKPPNNTHSQTANPATSPRRPARLVHIRGSRVLVQHRKNLDKAQGPEPGAIPDPDPRGLGSYLVSPTSGEQFIWGGDFCVFVLPAKRRGTRAAPGFSPFIDLHAVFVDRLVHEPGDANRFVFDGFRVGAGGHFCRRPAMERPSTDIGLGPVAQGSSVQSALCRPRI